MGSEDSDNSQKLWPELGGALVAVADLVIHYQDLILSVISITSSLFIDPLLSTILDWSVYAFGFFLIGRWVYDSMESISIRGPLLPVLFTIIALSNGALAVWGIGNSSRRLPVMALLETGIIVFSLLVFTVYLIYVYPGPSFGEGGALSRVAREFFSSTHKKRLEVELLNPATRSDLYGVRKRIELAALAGMVLSFPAMTAGFIIPILELTFPLPELLLILWAGWRIVLRQNEQAELKHREIGLQTHLERGLRWATYNLKAGGIFQIIFMGLGLSAATVWNATSLLLIINQPQFNKIVVSSSASKMTTVWGVIGMSVLLCVAGGYGIWAWVRELKRIEPFLIFWERRRNFSDRGENVIATIQYMVSSIWSNNLISARYDRAPGFVLVPVALSSLVSWVFKRLLTEPAMTLQQYEVSPYSHLWVLFGAVWPLILAVIIWMVLKNPRKTGRTQKVSIEDIIITGGFYLQLQSFSSLPHNPINSVWVNIISIWILFLPFSAELDVLITGASKESARKIRWLLGGTLLLSAVVSGWPIVARGMIVIFAIIVFLSGERKSHNKGS